MRMFFASLIWASAVTSTLASISNASHQGTINASATATIPGQFGWNIGDQQVAQASSGSGGTFEGELIAAAATASATALSRVNYSQTYRSDGFDFRSAALSTITATGVDTPGMTTSLSHLEMKWEASAWSTVSLVGTSTASSLPVSTYIRYVLYRYIDYASNEIEIVREDTPGFNFGFDLALPQGRYGMVVMQDLLGHSYGVASASVSSDMTFRIVPVPSGSTLIGIVLCSTAFIRRSRR